MLAAAFFLDFMHWQRPAKQVETSPWYEAAAALVRSQLAARAKEAPPVTHVCALGDVHAQLRVREQGLHA